MNRQSLTQSVSSIRTAIKTARDQDTNATLRLNYDIGIRICDDLIVAIRSPDAMLTVDELMGRFNRFVSDSLPWTESLLSTINHESKNIKKALSSDDGPQSS